ncbi:MAG TPA: substrate-binding domain-containing protein [Longimicrobiales bacterium]
MPLPGSGPGLAVLCFAAAIFASACDQATPEVHALVPDSITRAGDDVLAGFNTRDVPASPGLLRVCADPNNLPYSNARLEGFENRLAAIVAEEIGRDTAWVWFPQRRGFARQTLRAGRCDLIAGVPSSYELALTTAPYYRSTYVFVTRDDRDLDVASLDDARLRQLRIGLHTIGDDYTNGPAAEALARRGIVDSVVGYSIYGDYSQETPPARLIEAVARDEVDVAIAWGPIAGWAAQRSDVPLHLEPVTPQIDPPFTPFVYDMSMAVRRGEDSLKVAIEGALARRKPEIDALLAEYGVPLVRHGRSRRQEAGR